MANRLQKLADAQYTPGRPYQPGVPAYCVLVPYEVPGYYKYISYSVVDQDGNVHIYSSVVGYVPPQTTYVQQCYPAIPEVAAIPSTVTYNAIMGWNGGARSVTQLDGDGFFSFQVKENAAGVVVGLSDVNNNQLPSEPSHALFIQGTTLRVIESGEIVHTASVSHAYANVYTIRRTGLTVTYSTTGWDYTSEAPSAGAKFLDAAMYASGDYVDNPVMTVETPTGEASGSFVALVGAAYEGDYAEAYGSFIPLTGSAGVTVLNTGAGTLGALLGIASEGPYAELSGTLPALTGTGDGGYPQVSIIFGVGIMTPMACVALGLTGEVGSAAGTLEPLAGLASEGAYGEVRGTLPALTGYADTGWPNENEKFEIDVLLAGDFYLPSDNRVATISDTLELGDEFSYLLTVDSDIFDALLLSDNMTLVQVVDALITGRLILSNELSSSLVLDQFSNEPVQYAVNTLTGALTTYTGFGFTAFASVDQTMYGAKTDGVYRVRRGDDDGDPISVAEVDFGYTDFGTPRAKHVDAAYFGITTDGQVYAKMTGDDGVERTYNVVQRGDSARALFGKKLTSRHWNLVLTVVDPTELELDTVEQVVAVSTRRWTR